MQVHCAKCGEEVLGAVNRCWKCGHSFGQRLAAQLPPVRGRTIDGPLDRRPDAWGAENQQAGGFPATSGAIAGDGAEVSTATISLEEPPVIAEASDTLASDSAQRGIRVGSPFAGKWQPVTVAARAAPHGQGQARSSVGVRPTADVRVALAASGTTAKANVPGVTTFDTRAETQRQLRVAAGYTGLVLGVLSLMLSPWLSVSLIVAVVGLGLATWALLGRDRAIGLVALVLCALMILVSTYRWGVIVYKRLFPPPAWQSDYPELGGNDEDEK